MIDIRNFFRDVRRSNTTSTTATQSANREDTSGSSNDTQPITSTSTTATQLTDSEDTSDSCSAAKRIRFDTETPTVASTITTGDSVGVGARISVANSGGNGGLGSGGGGDPNSDAEYDEIEHYKQSGLTRSEFVRARKFMKKLLKGKNIDASIIEGSLSFTKLQPTTVSVTPNNATYCSL